MEKSKRFLSTFVIVSIGYLILGFVLLLAPETSKLIITYIVGAVAVVGGIFRTVLFFSKEDLSRVYRNDLAVGVTLILAGVYLFAWPEGVWAWVPVLLGFGVVFDSIIKMQYAFGLRRSAYTLWWAVLVASLATATLGALLILRMFSGNALLLYLGIVLVVDGLINIASVLLIHFRQKKAGKAAGKPPKKKAEAEAAPAQAVPEITPPTPPQQPGQPQ